MGKIDLTINKTGLQHNIEKAKENNVIIPTIAQMQHPETIPEKIQEKLKTVGLWDVNPLNLFRITWKNEAKETGGLYQAVPNYVEIPSELSGVPCRILAMARILSSLFISATGLPTSATDWAMSSSKRSLTFTIFSGSLCVLSFVSINSCTASSTIRSEEMS